MKINNTNKESKNLNILKKIALCILVITIILYYIISIQFLSN
ncbi:hypothetical protein FLAT13_02881 [Flavobacterium salmonis]|uniref:Uncharacterized protein n=1 Tax=Flavobacterium salmonis TaxID=2654844 RepID=A0A6V6Z261_9FLAO|nr:hypothetical protein FLAT13_02881 [Flavobacterium salmonis]